MSPHPDELFRPPAQAWNRLSPRYVRVKRITSVLANAILLTPVVVGSWFLFQLPWLTSALAVLAVAWATWRFVRARRWVASWGWAERDADLCITHGLWNRRLTIVPYGRLQVVNVSAGPILRSQGLASVELVTAASLTNATISGLPHPDAVALRDRMIELSDARDSGL